MSSANKSIVAAGSVDTFRNPKYTITTSLNGQTIYIKIINNVSYMCYEGNFDNASFKLPFGLENIYKLVHNCFEAFDNQCEREDKDAAKSGADSYRLRLELDNGTLHILFKCVVGGFLDVEFDLRLREKIMSNDSQLTINFQRVEQTQIEMGERINKIESKFTKKMAEMERRLEALGNAEICVTNPNRQGNWDVKSYNINAKQLRLQTEGNNYHMTEESIKKIKFFYQLEELTMTGFNSWARTVASNSTVHTLTLINSPVFNDISFIKNFPSLVELSMSGFAVDASIVTTLRSIKHKIKKLSFQNCGGINQTEMQTYCTQNGIALSLS
jgi:hypothetical protein